jgi:hypothetical protein
MGKRRKPDGVLEGTVNHYALLKHDADELTQMANAARGSFEMTITARSAILLYIVSLEVLINRVIDEFWPNSIPAIFQEDAKTWRTVDKWERIPEIVTGMKFKKGARPFQYLKPLIAARNDYVHAKEGTFRLKLDYRIEKPSGEIKTNPSKSHPKYDHIGLLKDPSEWIPEDAERVKVSCEELVTELDRLLRGRLTKDAWLTSDTLVSDQGQVIRVQRRYKPKDPLEKGEDDERDNDG